MNEANTRQCLPCTACCKGWLSADVLGQKIKAGTPCRYSKPEGCGVYKTRPESPCRTFICSWLVKNSPLPDWMRPDQSGVIVLLSMLWHGQRVISAIPVGRSIPEHSLTWLKNYAQENKRPLVFYERIMQGDSYSGLKRFGFGPPAFKRQVAQLAAEDPEAFLGMQTD